MPSKCTATIIINSCYWRRRRWCYWRCCNHKRMCETRSQNAIKCNFILFCLHGLFSQVRTRKKLMEQRKQHENDLKPHWKKCLETIFDSLCFSRNLAIVKWEMNLFYKMKTSYMHTHNIYGLHKRRVTLATHFIFVSLVITFFVLCFRYYLIACSFVYLFIHSFFVVVVFRLICVLCWARTCVSFTVCRQNLSKLRRQSKFINECSIFFYFVLCFWWRYFCCYPQKNENVFAKQMRSLLVTVTLVFFCFFVHSLHAHRSSNFTKPKTEFDFMIKQEYIQIKQNFHSHLTRIAEHTTITKQI